MESKRNFFKELFKQRYSYLFIAPAVILFSVFVFIPVIASFFLSFTKYNILEAPHWVGLGNYRRLLKYDQEKVRAYFEDRGHPILEWNRADTEWLDIA